MRLLKTMTTTEICLIAAIAASIAFAFIGAHALAMSLHREQAKCDRAQRDRWMSAIRAVQIDSEATNDAEQDVTRRRLDAPIRKSRPE